jgi:hypothetical protein
MTDEAQNKIDQMKHHQLVDRAWRYLVNSRRCSVTIRELGSGYEIPDVLGWYSQWASILIECKVTFSDFKNDQRKTFRNSKNSKDEAGLGNNRYYMVPMILKEKVLPLIPEHWGLLVATEKRILVEKESAWFEKDWRSEMGLMNSILRRVSPQRKPLEGVLIDNYEDGHLSMGKIFVIPENMKCEEIKHADSSR